MRLATVGVLGGVREWLWREGEGGGEKSWWGVASRGFSNMI